MTYKELVGYINEELNIIVPDSGCTVITTRPDVDIETVLTFTVETVLGQLTGTLEGYLRLICAFSLDSPVNLPDVSDAVTGAISKHYKPTAEGYVVGDYENTSYRYAEKPVVIYFTQDKPMIAVDFPVVPREYHRVEVGVVISLALEYAVTEAPADDSTGSEES